MHIRNRNFQVFACVQFDAAARTKPVFHLILAFIICFFSHFPRIFMFVFVEAFLIELRIKYEAEKELIRWKYKSEIQYTYKLLCTNSIIIYVCMLLLPLLLQLLIEFSFFLSFDAVRCT